MKLFRFFLVFTLILAISCTEEVVKEVTIIGQTTQETGTSFEDLYKTEGYIASSFISTSGGSTYYGKYYRSKPSGNIDLTKGNSYGRLWANDTYKFFMYGVPLNGTSTNFALVRYAVDKKTEKIIETGIIPLSNHLASVKIINDDLGVYTVRDSRQLYLFNPMTMQYIEAIDLSNGVNIENATDGSQLNSYHSIIYRPQDNKVFLPLSTNLKTTGPFYDDENVYVEVVDLTSRSWVKTTQYNQATYPLTRGAENSVIDETGNIYITCQGQYSLDGQVGPTAAVRSRPQILKIPAGSNDFDTSYSFNPVNKLGLNNLVAQFVTGTIYGSNGIAYAAISAKADDPRVLELLQKLSKGTITTSENNELRRLVIQGANSKWSKLDLNAKTAEVINDIPFTAGFGYPFSLKYNNKLYFETFNPRSGANGYYEFDPTTNTSSNVYNITAGGLAVQFIKLEK